METKINPKERFRKGFVLTLTLAYTRHVPRDAQRVFRGAAARSNFQWPDLSTVSLAAAENSVGAGPLRPC